MRVQWGTWGAAVEVCVVFGQLWGRSTRSEEAIKELWGAYGVLLRKY